MVVFISEKKLSDFIQRLSQEKEVWAPVKLGSKVIYQRITPLSSLNFDFKNSLSILPPKFLFLPPEEEVFQVKDNKIKEGAKIKPFILFCPFKDLVGILELDEIMAKEPKDYFYWRRREKAILVGIAQEKIEASYGGDLILERVNSQFYQVQALTRKGKNLIKGKFFEKKELVPQLKEKTYSSLESLLLDSELLKEAISWSREHPLWKELEEICLGCGICSNVCPLCYCFSFEDKLSFDGKECFRCRRWDSCLFANFAQIAGGKNFHPQLRDRLYNWYYHKFVRAYREFGRPNCIACGRCQRYCPAKIDIEKVLGRILKDYLEFKKSQK